MGTVIKTILIAAVVMAVAGFIGLFVMSGVASSHGVRRIDLPPGCHAAAVAEKADYTDAYQSPMTYMAFKSIDEAAAATFAPGREVQRTETEVAYTGYRGGARYDISYVLDRSADPPTITVATAVRLPSRKSRVYWFVAGRVHRMLFPYLLDRMAHSAVE